MRMRIEESSMKMFLKRTTKLNPTFKMNWKVIYTQIVKNACYKDTHHSYTFVV